MSLINQFAEEVRKVFNKKITLEDRKVLRELSTKDEVQTSQAIAVLLAEIAMIDQEFDDREYGYIFKHLEEAFDLDQNEIKNLISYGARLIENLQSTEVFSNHLKETLSAEERKELLKVINGLIKADGVEHGFEVFLQDRLKLTLEV